MILEERAICRFFSRGTYSVDSYAWSRSEAQDDQLWEGTHLKVCAWAPPQPKSSRQLPPYLAFLERLPSAVVPIHAPCSLHHPLVPRLRQLFPSSHHSRLSSISLHLVAASACRPQFLTTTWKLSDFHTTSPFFPAHAAQAPSTCCEIP